MSEQKEQKRGWKTAVSMIWNAPYEALRDFVWADLRDGLVSLRGLDWPTRYLVVVGFAMLLGMVGMLLNSDLIRSQTTLITLIDSGGNLGRGALMPQIVIPLTTFMLAVAWSFILTGTLHAHPLIRIGALIIFTFLLFINLFISILQLLEGLDGAIDLLILLAALGSLLAVPLLVFWRWRKPARPALEFGLMFLFVATLMAGSQFAFVRQWRNFDIPVGFAALETYVASLEGFVFIFMVLVGLEIAFFTLRAADWSREIVAKRLPGWMLYGLLGLLYVVQVVRVGRGVVAYFRQEALSKGLLGYAGALGEPMLVFGTWWLVHVLARRQRPFTLSTDALFARFRQIAVPVVIIFNGVFLLNYVFITFLPLIGFAGILGLAPAMRLFASSLQLFDRIAEFADVWGMLVAGGAVLAAVVLARRKQIIWALYLGSFGSIILWHKLTVPERPLSFLSWRGPEPVDFWWVLLLILVAIVWLRRRQLSPRRAGILLMLGLVTTLLRQTDFIENPFSPFLSFAGVGFLAFGILWDALTIGSWANDSSPALPRISRIFLYVGYVLLTIIVINWALNRHDLGTLNRFTGDYALLGLDAFGRPMLYILFPMLFFKLEDKNVTEAQAGTGK